MSTVSVQAGWRVAQAGRRAPLAFAATVVALASLPYLAAWALRGDEVFTGIVFNYRDANLYLAMLRQGLAGSWRYQLAYTSEPHAGASIYVFFLALGHAARLLTLEPIVVLHLARVAAGLLMLLSAWWLLGRLLPGDGPERATAFALTALGSGLGWLLAVAGVPASEIPDLFMPEAIPFLAVLVEPHYPLALALLLTLTGLIVAPPAARRGLVPLAIVLLGVLLALVKPYPFLVLGGALALYLLARWVVDGCVLWIVAARGALAALAGLPVVVYDALASRGAPVIAEWWAADVASAPSPPPWHYALAYAWVLLPAVLGAGWLLRTLRSDAARPNRRAAGPSRDTAPAGASNGSGGLLYAVCWAVANAVLLYLPGVVPQRPLALGLQLPLAALAAVGLHRVLLAALAPAWQARARAGWIAASSVVNVLLVALALVAVLPGDRPLDAQASPVVRWGHVPTLFVRADEWAGLMWLREQAPPGALVLASADTSVFVPAWAGLRVIAGHPDHTTRAREKEAALARFFAVDADPVEQRALLETFGPDFIWYGPREQARAAPAPALDREWRVVFEQGLVTIYRRVGGQALR